jgi:hypothetical protein
MPSCFKCAVVDGSTADADPIGVCLVCNSLACYDHGTRLKKAAHFECVLCLPKQILTSAGLVRHEVYPGQPPGDRGGPGVPAAPEAPDRGGGGGAAREFVSTREFEQLEPQVAERSLVHRTAARAIVEPLVERMAGLADNPAGREQEAGRLAVTSDRASVAELDAVAAELALELQEAMASGGLDKGLLADALGVAAWAINTPIAGDVAGNMAIESMSVNLIGLIADLRLQLLLRAWSEHFTFTVA